MWQIHKICNLNLSRNQYFVIGFVIGFLYSYYAPEDLTDVVRDCPGATNALNAESYESDFEPKLNLEQKPMIAKKQVKNIVRPRYYYTELGIREKLFIGILTSQEDIDTLATAINKTSAHLVNKIKFFINADNVKSNFKLKNIVGFTDTRENLRPFHVLKYIADNYLDDYDFFFLITDSAYINARLLKEKLNHISVSFDVYLGSRLADDPDDNRPNSNQYCNIDTGIVLSSSVIKKIRANLDWCVRNSPTEHHSLNIGKCVKYSSKIDSCQTSWQGINIPNYKLNNFKIYRDLQLLEGDKVFNSAIVVQPVRNPDDFYMLHGHFSKVHLKKIRQKINEIDKNSQKISNGTIPNSVLQVRWPLGVPHPNPPETRHDLIPWTHLNMTHSFMWDAETNVKKLPKIEKLDMDRIVNKTIQRATESYPDLEFKNLHTAYRKFDPVRGMDYKLLINFVDKKTKEVVLKSFEVMKPLGLIEIVPSPYVTESTRVAILLPTFENQAQDALNFIKSYEKVCMENQDNTFLMLILMYKEKSSSKGTDDVFLAIKNLALSLTEKYKNDGSRIAWVSIRLPAEFSQDFDENDIFLNSVYGRNEILSFAATDLALRKIGLESLVMICSNSAVFRSDFLNRVRMNTIQGFQVFSPIGFTTYPCRWTKMCKECESCDVAQSTGYFDRSNNDVISFYSQDYVEARKKLEDILPIVRSDKDIISLIFDSEQKDHQLKNIMDMFVKSGLEMHVLRGIEPNLRFGNSLKNFLMRKFSSPNDDFNLQCTTEDERKCLRMASRKQFGDALVQQEIKNNEVK